MGAGIVSPLVVAALFSVYNLYYWVASNLFHIGQSGITDSASLFAIASLMLTAALSVIFIGESWGFSDEE